MPFFAFRNQSKPNEMLRERFPFWTVCFAWDSNTANVKRENSKKKNRFPHKFIHIIWFVRILLYLFACIASLILWITVACCPNVYLYQGFVCARYSVESKRMTIIHVLCDGRYPINNLNIIVTKRRLNAFMRLHDSNE